MKFVVAWTIRDKSEAAQKGIIQAFEAWTPPAEVTEMLSRIDGKGGGLIVETDDPQVLVDLVSPFGQWLDYEISPVISPAEAVEAVKANLK